MSTNNIRIFYIYIITNNLNNKNYIGQRLCPVNKTPDTDKYMGSGVRLHCAYDKYGVDNFSKEIVAICYSKDIIDILEKEYIALYRSIGKAEYNVADGGQSFNSTSELWKENQRKVIQSEKWKTAHKNAIETEEYHQKLRDGQQRRWSSEEERNKYSENTKKQWQDPEFRNKMLESRKGHVCTDECKKKIGEKNRLNYIGCHWYTNGKKDVLSRECPKGFVLGRSNFHGKGKSHDKMSEKQKQYYRDIYTGVVWWNNGVEQVRSKTQPEGFVRGTLSKGKYHWYNNGVINIRAKECPEGFREGRLHK